jgi:hypothetical protein
MRHLLALPLVCAPVCATVCAALAACAAPAPQAAGRFTLEQGASVEAAPGLTLRFEAVEDSRCPPGARCVRAGTLRYRFALRRGSNAPEAFTLSPGEPAAAPAALGGRRVVLDEATVPVPPVPGTSITYRATIGIHPANPPTP